MERETKIMKILTDKGQWVCLVIKDSKKPATMKKGIKPMTIFSPFLAAC